MRKKALFLTLFLFILGNFVFSNDFKSFSEIEGGIGTVLMGNYNDDVSKITNEYLSMGAKPDLQKVNSCPVFSISGVYINKDLIGWYFRWDVLPIKLENIVRYPDNKIYYHDNIDLSTWYYGIGVRKYFFKEHKRYTLYQFIGFDMGLGWSNSNEFNIHAYYSDGTELTSALAFMSGLFFGAHLEAGVNYWLNKNFGIVVKAGARYMKGEISDNIKTSNDLIWKDGESVKQEVDYTGVYAKIGITIDFMGDDLIK